MCPAVITHWSPWLFLLSSCHRTLVCSTRWELTQLFLWMAAMFLFCFLLTLLSSFILFLLCLDKKVIYDYLWSPIFLLVFCNSLPLTHSDYFTPLLEAHQRHPNTLGIKFKILIIAHKVLQDLAPAVLSDFICHHPYPSFTLLELHGTSLCALDKTSSSCFWPCILTVLTSPSSSDGWLILSCPQ